MKKIITLFLAALVSVGMMADTKRVYCKMTYSWWTADGAAIGVYAYGSGENAGWPGERMTPVDGDEGVWYAEVDTKYTNLIFVRVSGSGNVGDWGAQTEDLTFPTGENNLYTITSSTGTWSGSGNKCTGTWSKYVEPTEPIVHTYTVAGSPALFGSNWKEDDANNDMKLVDGLYTWSASDVLLSDGTITFKVCQDHAWTHSWPAQNYELSIDKGGKYDVTITFNESTKAVAANAELKEEVVVLPTIALRSNFSGSWADTEEFEQAGDKKTASLTINLERGNYEFGVQKDATWISNGVAFDREHNSAAVVAGSGNLTLAADTKGDYTFTWTYETNTLSIEFPEYVPSLPVIKITGSWNKWGDPTTLEAAQDEKTAAVAMELETGTYEFKVIKDGAWKTKANGGEPYGLHRGWPGVSGVADDAEENIRLTADKAGTYTFTWTFANDSIGIAFPELVKSAVTISAGANLTLAVKNGEAAVASGAEITEGTELTITATPAEDYEITTLKAYKTGDEATAVAITDGKLTMPAYPITITATATAIEYQTLYYVNKDNWENVYGYVFNSEEDKKAGWPGEAMTKTAYKVETADIYSYRFPAKYAKIIFNNGKEGGDEEKTSDQTWSAAKPYYCAGIWYATAEECKLNPNIKFYITGDAALVGEGSAWNMKAIAVEADSYTFENLAVGTYKMKVNVDGNNDTWKGYSELTDKTVAGVAADGDNNIVFTLVEAGDVTVTYTADPAVFKVEGTFFTIADGYYLFGTPQSWSIFNLTAANKFAAADAEGEYKLTTTLEVDQAYKVIKVESNTAAVWYPAEGENFVVTAVYAGEKTIYFRPEGNYDWSLLSGHIYIEPNHDETGVGNVQGDRVRGTKIIENGVLYLKYNGTLYNVQGQVVR